jgi:S1-C subfamily serine protease
MRLRHYFIVAVVVVAPFGNRFAVARQRTKPPIDPIIASINSIRSSIVQVAFTSNAPDPKYKRGVAGTGFFVSKEGYVLTANHVINETESGLLAKGATKIDFQVGISIDATSNHQVSFRGSFTLIPCSVKDTDPMHDVAILQPSQNPFAPGFRVGVQIGTQTPSAPVSVAKLKDDLPPEGQSALVSGYPLSIPTLVTQKGMVASETYALLETHPPNAPAGFTMPEAEDIILLDAVVNPGNSGGPVYLVGADSVIGVCEGFRWSPLFTNKSNPVPVSDTEFLTENSGLAVVIPIKYAIALLQKNKILTPAINPH